MYCPMKFADLTRQVEAREHCEKSACAWYVQVSEREGCAVSLLATTALRDLAIRGRRSE